MSNKDDENNSITPLADNPVIRNTIQNISDLMNTGLSKESLDICIKLMECGVHPQALAEVVNQIRRNIETINDE